MKGPVLAVALLLLTALGLAGAFIPFKPCGACHGFARKSTARPLNCPDCADRGNVSLFRSWIPGVSEPVGEFLGVLREGQVPFVFGELHQLVRNHGEDSEAFLAGSTILLNQRFIDAEGKTYLVLILQAFNTIADTSARTAILLTADGRPLDRVLVSTDGHNASLNGGFLERAPGDGPRLVFGWNVSRWPEALRSYQVEQWQRPARELLLRGKRDDPLLHLLIRGDRFEILWPEVQR